MDDTSRRVGRPEDMRGRAAEETAGRSREAIGGYAGPTERAPVPAGGAAPGQADDEARTSDIRRDIEQTREEMSETIDAIQEKLRPANVVASATQRVKDATTERVRQMTQSAGDAANRVMYGSHGRSEGIMSGIRENPIPAALIGLGAAWWYMNSRSSTQGERGPRYGRAGSYSERLYADDRAGAERGEFPDYEREYGAGYSRGYAARPGSYGYRSTEGEGWMDRVKDHPVPAALAGLGLAWLAMAGRSERDWERDPWDRSSPWEAEDEGSAMSSVTESVSGAASGVADTARRMTSGAREHGGEAAERMRQRGRRAQSDLERLARENPLAVGAGALLLGAAVGLAIPETERENEWMGEARDSMVDRAQEMAQKAAATAQDAAADLAGEAASRVVKGATSE